MPEDRFKRRPKPSSGLPSGLRPDERFQLVAKLISTPEVVEGVARSYLDFEELIRDKFLRLTGEVGIPGESRLFNDLLLLLKGLRDLVEFPHLANKNVLAIGGGFSSGKSRFINALLGGEKLLPYGINPTTAIPTYLTNGDSETIRTLNTFNRSEELSRKDFQAISHAFNEDEMSPQNCVSFYHILKLVQIQTPMFKWKNVALIDTPGYSKPHSAGVSALIGTNAGNTDEEKAREHLSQADHLIWAVPATSGTLRQDDIDFLKDKVQWDKPVYLLITKCDESTDANLRDQVCQICDDFAKTFHMAGWSAYSSKRKEVLDGDDPCKWLDAIDAKVKYTQWRGRFKAVIDKVVRFNASEEESCSALEKSLKPVFLNCDDVLEDAQISAVKKAMDRLREERGLRSKATARFVSFGNDVERRLDDILTRLGITDETASSVGLVATMKYSEKKCNLKKGDVVFGVVEVFMKFTGCFLKVDGMDQQAKISIKELNRAYSSPNRTFAVGKRIRLSVYDVDYGKKVVTFTATPAETRDLKKEQNDVC